MQGFSQQWLVVHRAVQLLEAVWYAEQGRLLASACWDRAVSQHTAAAVLCCQLTCVARAANASPLCACLLSLLCRLCLACTQACVMWSA